MTITTTRDDFGNFVSTDSEFVVPATAPTASFHSAPVNAFAGNEFEVVFDLVHPSVLLSSITVSTLTVTGPSGSTPVVRLGYVRSLGTYSGYRVQWLVNPLDGEEGYYNCQIQAAAFTSTTPTPNTVSDSVAVRIFGNPFNRPLLAPNWQNVLVGSQGVSSTDPAAGSYNRYRIPMLVVAGNGDLLLFAEGRELGDQNRVSTIYSRSTDNGATWEPEVTVATNTNPLTDTVGNPSVLVDELTQRIHLFYTFEEQDLIYRYSDDHGVTWSATTNLTPSLTSGFFNDIYVESSNKRRFRVGPGGGTQLKLGEYAGRLIVIAFFRFGTGPEDRVIASVYSDNNGATWSIGNWTTSGAEAHIAELNDGSLVTINRNQELLRGQFKIINRSTDGGLTWGAYDVVDGEDKLVECVCQNSLERLWFGTGDENNIILTALDSTDLDIRSVLYLALSRNDSTSWPNGLRRVLYKYWAGYSDCKLLPDGYIGITCEKDQNFFIQNLAFTKVSLSWLLDPNNDLFYESLEGVSPSPAKVGNFSNFSASTRNGWTADGTNIGQYYDVINDRRRSGSGTTFENTTLGAIPAQLRIQFAARVDRFDNEASSGSNVGFRITCVRNDERSYLLVADDAVLHRTPADDYPVVATVTTEALRWYEWRLDIDFTNNVTTVFRDGIELGSYPIETIGFSNNYLRFFPGIGTNYSQLSLKWGALDDNLS